MQNLYPPQPGDINEEISKPSAAFKKEVVKVFFLCVLFLVWYLVLLAATVGIAFLIGFLAVLLFMEVGHFTTGMLALGAIIMGIMLVFFMLKALVVKKGDPVPTIGEVTEGSEPVLFNFIKKVCQETKAPFPKRIFLINEINAFVTYDSTFLSLFFPARKNLYIGLGLVNCSTISELKAVIAHEFGHFSQGSMRFGSYVYHFNQIIYKIVTDNPDYNALVEKWASYSNYFVIFANINFTIIRGIRWLMAKFYGVLNKGYMALSRQMEFHADAVAARVSGSSPLVSSLYRMDLAAASYDHLLSYYDGLVKENLKAQNFYTQHFKLMQLLAIREAVEIKNGFPMIDASTINRMGRSRIVVKDQWASHPSVEERDAALTKLNIASETIDEPAWRLFSAPAELQRSVTETLYTSVNFSEEPLLLSDEEFEEKYNEFLRVNNFQPEYKSYYNNRNISRFDVSLDNYVPEDLSLEELISEEHIEVQKLVSSLESDIAILECIGAAGSGYKSFDFEGLRYPVHDALTIRAYLAKEMKLNQDKMKKHDQEIFYIARHNALARGSEKELETAFLNMFEQTDRTEKDISLFNELYQEVSKAYTQLSFAAINQLVSRILDREKQLKERMQEILKDERILKISAFKNDLDAIRRLCESNHSYFGEGGYLNEELELLNEASTAFLNISTGYSFELKKLALECQVKFLKPEAAGIQTS